MPYDPQDWYWLASDGRICSSRRSVTVPSNDPDYAAWSQNNAATPWPRDAAGNQTDAALQDVLTPYGLFANLTYYAANARYNRAGSGLTISSISPIPFLTDPVSRNTVNSAWNYAGTQPANYSVQWKMSDGSFITLSKSQLTAVANDMSDFVEKCFKCESTTVSQIKTATITTEAQVDAAFAAVSNVYATMAAEAEAEPAKKPEPKNPSHGHR